MALAKTLFVFFGYCATAFAKPYPNLDGTNIQFGVSLGHSVECSHSRYAVGQISLTRLLR